MVHDQAGGDAPVAVDEPVGEFIPRRDDGEVPEYLVGDGCGARSSGVSPETMKTKMVSSTSPGRPAAAAPAATAGSSPGVQVAFTACH